MRTRRVKRMRGGNKLFTKAYVITMDEFPERFKRIKGFADKAGLELHAWKGVKVTPDDIHSLPEKGIGTTHSHDRAGKTFNLGVIGSFLAHRSLLEHAANDSGPGTLIFEDDVEIPKKFFEKLNAHISELPEDWDVLFLDKRNTRGEMVSKHMMRLTKDMTAQYNWGFWSFIVRTSSLKSKILPTMEHMLDVADLQLNKFADIINMYLLVPSVVKLDDSTASNSLIVKLDLQ